MTEAIPPGYKKTEIGIIPEDWEVKRLGEIGKIYQPETISQSQLSNNGKYFVYGTLVKKIVSVA